MESVHTAFKSSNIIYFLHLRVLNRRTKSQMKSASWSSNLNLVVFNELYYHLKTPGKTPGKTPSPLRLLSQTTIKSQFDLLFESNHLTLIDYVCHCVLIIVVVVVGDLQLC